MSCRGRNGRILALPPERRSPTRQVLRIPRKRAGSEVGAPPLPPSRGQYQGAPAGTADKFTGLLRLRLRPSFSFLRLERFNKNCSHLAEGLVIFGHANNLTGSSGTHPGFL